MENMTQRQEEQLKFTDIVVLQTWERKAIVLENSYYGLSQASDIYAIEPWGKFKGMFGNTPVG